MAITGKILLSIIICCLQVNSFGQKVHFPKQSLSDSSATAKAMTGLAQTLIEHNRSVTDRIASLSNLFRYELVVGNYQASIITIDSLKNTYNDPADRAAAAFPYYVYSTAMLNKNGFEKGFDPSFLAVYNGLPFKAATVAENYYVADLRSRQQRFLEMANRFREETEDSITLQDAQTFCVAYLNYIVYTATIPKAKVILQKIFADKYDIDENVLLTMRDGAKVSATIVRERNVPGPQSVIFKFGIYAQESVLTEARFIASHGYAAVIADTRGKRLSNDMLEPFEHDGKDAYDIIDWISKQSWCNGKVGMYGGSYLGFTQWAAAKKVHPALKTIVPQVAVGIGVDFPGLYGVQWSDMLRWINIVSNNKLTDWNGTGNKVSWETVRDKWYSEGLAFNSLDTIEGRPNAIFQRFIQHPAYDRYWTSMVPYQKEFAKINIPVLSITGYYDDDQRGALYYYHQHHLYNPKANHYLLIGPYDHGGAQGYPLDPAPVLYGYPLDSAARIHIIDVVFQWFDHVLKNGPQPAIIRDKINFQVMGGNRWRHVPSLTKMNNDTLTFYLSDRSRLTSKKVTNPKPIVQTIDLRDRTTDEKDIVINSDGGIIDTAISTRNQVLFVSEPLLQDYELNGSFISSLNLIVNKKDMDITIRLYQQLPDGKYFQLSNNVARLSYLKDPAKRQLLTPGKLHHVYFDNSFFTSRLLKKGSRIVLLIGINNNPYWQVNYGTGKDVNLETMRDASIPFRIEWITDKSFIQLPVWK